MAQVQAYRSSYGGNLTDELLQQMQVPQQVLQQMIQEKAELTEAERSGITVSDAEVRAQIMAIPGLQENGQFIGEERYRQLLAQQRPPMTPADFEQIGARRADARQVPGRPHRMDVGVGRRSRARVQAPQRKSRRSTSSSVLADNFKTQVNPTDAEISAHFDKNKEKYRIPDQRKIKFVRVNPAELAAEIKVPKEDVERNYNAAPRHVHDARTNSREPYPADDRRQRRRRRCARRPSRC